MAQVSPYAHRSSSRRSLSPIPENVENPHLCFTFTCIPWNASSSMAASSSPVSTQTWSSINLEQSPIYPKKLVFLCNDDAHSSNRGALLFRNRAPVAKILRWVLIMGGLFYTCLLFASFGYLNQGSVQGKGDVIYRVAREELMQVRRQEKLGEHTRTAVLRDSFLSFPARSKGARHIALRTLFLRTVKSFSVINRSSSPKTWDEDSLISSSCSALHDAKTLNAV